MGIEEKFNEAKETMQKWVDEQGHERCRYYPDLFNKLVDIFDIKMTKDPALPPRAEFEEGCRRYQKEPYETTSPSSQQQ